MILRPGILSLIALLSLVFTPLAPAQDPPIEATVTCSLDKDRERIETSDTGSGGETTQTPDFTLKVKNTSFNDVSKIRVKLCVMAAINDFTNNTPVRVEKVIEKKDFAVASNEEKEFPIGTTTFKMTHTTKGNVMYRTGQVYEGFAAEIYVDDRLIDTVIKGGRDVRKAYEKFVEAGGKLAGSRE